MLDMPFRKDDWVARTVCLVRTVGERRMRRVGIMSNTKPLPLRDVIARNVCVIRSIGGITGEIGNDTHCSNANDAFEREIGLVAAKMLSACAR